MYQKRRQQFIQSLPPYSIALFFSGKAPYSVGDEKYEFSVDRNFYYLTGLDKEDMILAFFKGQSATPCTLYILPYDEEIAKWIGGRITPEEATDISAIQHVEWRDNALSMIGEQIDKFQDFTDKIHIFADFKKQEAFQDDRPAFTFCRELKQLYPHIELMNLHPMITALRLVKDETEIQQLKQAICITNEAILRMMKHADLNMSENQLEAHFDFVLKYHDAKHSFPNIIASGSNATVLHYAENNDDIANHDLVLCDVGAAYSYMNADITRTFPISGTFTKRQRQIYDIVLRANKYMIQLVKPGLTLRGLNNELLCFYEKELNKAGLLTKGKTVHDYYWHGVSHMLGLETHDVTLSDYQLKPGNVLTIEPGLYLEDEGIGIRIEDDILVTAKGSINLSKDIIKEAEDIERFMLDNTIRKA